MAGGPDESGGEGGNGRRGGKHRGRSGRRRFKLADTAQQIVGGLLLAGPFVVTEEVWVLASDMTWLQALSTVLIGYGALYKADDERDPDRESEVAGIPTRFVSLMLVSYGPVAILSLAFGAPDTFLEGT